MTVSATAAFLLNGLTFVSPVVAAGAADETITTLSSNSIAVETSTGKHLMLTVDAMRFARVQGSDDTDSRGTVRVGLATENGAESHQWAFRLARGSFTSVDSNGHLETGTQVEPFGTVALSITPTGPDVQVDCGSGSYTRAYPVDLEGSLTIVTESTGKHKWGTVSLPSASFTAGTLTGSYGYDAEQACTTFPACVAALSWTVDRGSTILHGETTGDDSTIGGFRLAELHSPRGAARSDSIEVAAPKPRLSVHGTKAKLVILSNHGTGAITTSRASPYEQDCRSGAVKGKWRIGSYEGGAPAVKLSAQVFGSFTIGRVSSAQIIKTHVVPTAHRRS